MKNIKWIGLLIGAVIFVSILQTIQLISSAKAHSGDSTNGKHNHMTCMMDQMSLEEMDKNNDGICDFCGMPVSECGEMMGEDENMEEMMREYHGTSGMSCHM